LMAFCLFVLGPTLAWADPLSLGRLVEYSSSSEGLEVEAEGGRLFVAPLDNATVCVRVAPKNPNPAQSVKLPTSRTPKGPSSYRLEEGLETLKLFFGDFGVEIQKNPIRVGFVGRGGDVLFKEMEPLTFGPAPENQGFKAELALSLSKDTHVYGLGEKTGPLDKSGLAYTNWNLDNFGYGLLTDPLYLSCPFFIALKGIEAFGFFLDNPARVQFDFGAHTPGRTVISQECGDIVYYVFFGPSIPEVARRYAELTGKSPMPPLWALGHSYAFRYSDQPKEDILKAAQNAKSAGFPLDSIWMDTYAMEDLKSFTVNIPDFNRLAAQLEAQGVRLVNIVDPLIEADENYAVFQEGMAMDAFVKRKDGSVYTGMSPLAQDEGMDKRYVLPDFTRKDVRLWWGGLFQGLLDSGIEGFWHDLNEPTIVNSLEEWSVNYPKTLQDDAVFGGEDGQKNLSHTLVHNAYGLLMCRASFEGLERLMGTKRPFLVSRSGFSGIQRYAWVWTGDNVSSFEHLGLANRIFLGLGLSGIPFAGADIGGFVPLEWPELTVRWYQAAVLTPLFRKHKSNPLGYDHGPWTLPEPYLSAARKAIFQRYELLPYLYTCVYAASKTGEPVLRPLVYAYQDDETTHRLDDEYLAGESVLIAPVLESGELQRRVYLPDGVWYDASSKKPIRGPSWIYVPAPLDRLPMFIKAGSIIPKARLEGVPSSSIMPQGTLLLDVYPPEDGKEAESWLYLDDGVHTDSPSALFRFSLRRQGQEVSLDIEREGDYQGVATFDVKVFGLAPKRILKDGGPVPFNQDDEGAMFSIEAKALKLEVLSEP
jgi:alpha-glucosidase